ncbi:hypothetical protein HWA87_gp02 [Salmonella phage 35]|uniref:Uncharacterized protein n=1 Tax=Salmonella phage 35 TaxID=1654888 RepID=A0A0N7CA90_9CAUD|nr:hypothetical protein HWA87_gp02 [Salmonella phage 35]AKJ74065.1 hypothetical protein SP35_2 [Salmonella phage 35]
MKAVTAKKTTFNLSPRIGSLRGAVFHNQRRGNCDQHYFHQRSNIRRRSLARTWAEFRFQIGDRDVLFRVTSPVSKHEAPLLVTHAASGYRVCDVWWDDVAKTRFNAGRNNYSGAGARALVATIERVGQHRFLNAIKAYPNE